MNLNEVVSVLAPTGVLRAGINLSNFLLVKRVDESGLPIGVAPDMAGLIAEQLGVKLSLVTFPSPGELADAVQKDVWDIGLIAAEPARAETISFTSAYVEIEATYMVPAESSLKSIEDVDKPGIRIAVSARSAYDLYLTRNLRYASLVRAKGLAAASELYLVEKLDALAGLRPGLLNDADAGNRILEGRFTAVQQSVGTATTKSETRMFLDNFVRDAKSSGRVQHLIERHGMTGRLLVAP